jgi:hypothetical protein
LIHDLVSYDDAVLCNIASSQYKSGKNLFIADKQLGLALSPNPATEEVIVSWVVEQGVIPTSVALTNSMGILMQEQRVAPEDKVVVFHLTNLPAGIYYCKATMSNGQMITDILTIVK